MLTWSRTKRDTKLLHILFKHFIPSSGNVNKKFSFCEYFYAFLLDRFAQRDYNKRIGRITRTKAGDGMFRNLEAEQRRIGWTNEQMAKHLNISRATYEAKKKHGTFNLSQAQTMMRLFKCSFDYLFSTAQVEPNTQP